MKSDKNNEHLTWRHTRVSTRVFRNSLNAYRSGKLLRTKVVDKNETHVLLPVHSSHKSNEFRDKRKLLFVVNNMDQFTSNFTIHNKKTRQNMDLHLPSSKLTIYQKGTYYMAITTYNSLPVQIKGRTYDVKQFKKDFTLCRNILTVLSNILV
jgi:hypothetical protein